MTQDFEITRFGALMFELLDKAVTTSTYKYAVLLGLIDACQSKVEKDGSAATMVTTRELARKVLDYYWLQSREFVGPGNEVEVLKQNTSGQAKILTAIICFRKKQTRLTNSMLAEAQIPDKFRTLLDKVELSLIQMPLPRLQRFGSREERFIYEINWDESIAKRVVDAYQSGVVDPDGFDNRIQFVGNAAEHLLRLAPLLRPLIQREWASTVAGINRLPFATLESFLFDPQRLALRPVVPLLLDVQEGRCFYCNCKIRSGQVDHFIPWSRSPNDGLENFVLADESCNGSKSNHLASVVHLRRWVERNELRGTFGERFARAKEDTDWPQNPEQSLALARAAYRNVYSGMPLWENRKKFASASSNEIQLILGGE